jgi:hypothetical protein
MWSLLDFMEYIFELEIFISEYLTDCLKDVRGLLWGTNCISYALMALDFTVCSTY